MLPNAIISPLDDKLSTILVTYLHELKKLLIPILLPKFSQQYNLCPSARRLVCVGQASSCALAWKRRSWVCRRFVLLPLDLENSILGRPLSDFWSTTVSTTQRNTLKCSLNVLKKSLFGSSSFLSLCFKFKN